MNMSKQSIFVSFVAIVAIVGLIFLFMINQPAATRIGQATLLGIKQQEDFSPLTPPEPSPPSTEPTHPDVQQPTLKPTQPTPFPTSETQEPFQLSVEQLNAILLLETAFRTHGSTFPESVQQELHQLFISDKQDFEYVISTIPRSSDEIINEFGRRVSVEGIFPFLSPEARTAISNLCFFALQPPQEPAQPTPEEITTQEAQKQLDRFIISLSPEKRGARDALNQINPQELIAIQEDPLFDKYKALFGNMWITFNAIHYGGGDISGSGELGKVEAVMTYFNVDLGELIRVASGVDEEAVRVREVLLANYPTIFFTLVESAAAQDVEIPIPEPEQQSGGDTHPETVSDTQQIPAAADTVQDQKPEQTGRSRLDFIKRLLSVMFK